jgi:hypothetical protein
VSDQTRRLDVRVVVDPGYTGALEELAAQVPVWIVATPANREACQRIWDRRRITDHRLPGSVTSYEISDGQDRESNLLNALPVLEEHYYTDDAYMPLASDPDQRYLHLPNGFGLDVIGLNLANDLKAGLKDFGFDSFLPTAVGFQAWLSRKHLA